MFLVPDTPKSIICKDRQGFEHLNLCNLDLFRILVRRRRIALKAKMSLKSLAKKSGHNLFDFQSIKRYDGYRLAHIIAAVLL